MNQFSELGLSESILKALGELGFENPTPIQQQSIPLLLGGPSDLIGLAQTGTGKTAAFGLPLLSVVDPKKTRTPQALVLAPTRELGMQIANELQKFGKYLPKTGIEAVYGGASIVNQIRALRGSVQIVIATPGRLIDLINRKAIQLDEVRYVVLDEADEMLNMGFKEDIDKILSYTPKDKNTWLFSATMPKGIREIVKHYMKSPAEISVNTGQTVNKNIEHTYVQLRAGDKLEILKRFIDHHVDMRGVVFCRTKAETQNIADKLIKQGYTVEALHGDMTQGQREKVMGRFKAHTLKLLIATDVAARGIDVDDLTHVIHYSLPDNLEYYTHRSGRTARAGKKGISLAFVTAADKRKKLNFIESKLGLKFTEAEVPKVEDILTRQVLSWVTGILETKMPKEIDEELLSSAIDLFSGIEKEELIKLLLAGQLNTLGYNGNDDRDFKASGRDDDRRGDRRDRDRGDRGSRPSKKGVHRYFINLGTMDGVDKRSLLDFISMHSDVPANNISDLSLLRTHAYFDVDEKLSRKLSGSFKDAMYNDRPLRVNRDEQSNEPSSKSRSGKPRSRGGSGSKPRGGNSGGKKYGRPQGRRR